MGPAGPEWQELRAPGKRKARAVVHGCGTKQRTIAIEDSSDEGGDEAPEQAGRVQLLSQEVAEQQRGRVHDRDAAQVERVDRQDCGRNDLGHLQAVP